MLDRFSTDFFGEVVWPASVAFGDEFFDCLAFVMIDQQKLMAVAFAVKFDEFVILFFAACIANFH